MKIIIPMAGWGTRLRPHTLTIPKPMFPIAGKPIVQRLLVDLIKSTDQKVEDIVFVIRQDFGKQKSPRRVSRAGFTIFAMMLL